MILGIDCSHWQPPLNWYDWWTKGYRFAFVKVTEGTGWEDPDWLEHASAAVDAGFLVGPYHFFRSDYNGTKQGEWMHSVASKFIWDLPPVLDVESNPGNLDTAAYAARVRAALNEMRTLFDRKPLVYTSASKWKYTGNISVDADLWVAHYTSASSPYMPVSWTGWKFWQYTSTPLDQNRFNGTYEELQKYAGTTPTPPPIYKVTVTHPAEVSVEVIQHG